MSLRKRIFSVMLMLLTVLTTFSSSLVTVKAADSSVAYKNLYRHVKNGNKFESKQNSSGQADLTNLRNNKYKLTGGGYWTYGELMGTKGAYIAVDATVDVNKPLFDTNLFSDLTAGGKQEFLQDILTVANSCSYYSINSITDDTVTDLYNELQTYSGMGSQLMASLLSETKPDYATANRIYKPFSGVVGTILGFLSIIVLALVGVTMALDVCYITIPTFQLIIGAEHDGSGSGNGAVKTAAKIISIEAQKAVQASNGDGNNGDFKAPIGIYFKYRWKGLIILFICLLYLVGGHIWSFIAWLVDLLSGFLGF